MITMKKISVCIMMIFGAAFIISSCTATRHLPEEKQIQKKWTLITIDNVNNEKVNTSHAYIELSRDGKGGAKADCNLIFFSYKVLPDYKIKFSGVGSTMMACPDMEVESEMAKLIPLINNYELRDGMLILKIDGKEVMSSK